MQVEIITIGDELISGMTTDTNASFIGRRLTESGFEVRWISTVGDHEADLKDALQRACDRASIIVLTGGLGPTHDDITRKTISQFFGSKLIFREDLYERIESYFQNRGLSVASINRGQAEVPEKAEIIENEIGTAAGLKFIKEGRTFFVLPGVPDEMKRMMEKSVLPSLRQEGKTKVQKSLLLRTTGIVESELYQKINDFNHRFPEVKLAFLPHTAGVDMRLMIFGSSIHHCEEILNQGETYIRSKVNRYIYGTGDAPIEEAVAELLFKNRLTVAVAESCTGGLVSHKLTNIPGSSNYFMEGLVVYSNNSKTRLLDVPEETIAVHGAVSLETARALAEGVRRKVGTDIGISITGIAGPAGGTAEKPVGLVYIGYADRQGIFTENHRFMRDRLWNKERSAVAALDLIRKVLLGYVKITS